jgi:phospholipid/cholesterol/gamma-HCH transport system permease protein
LSARALAVQCTRIGAAVLPSVIVGSALVGCAWIVQSADAATALITLVSRVPRAIGPLVAGILVAARVGAMLAGEFGELRRGQQVDWLRAAGLSPLRQLVLPRLLAVVLIMPVATLVADASLLAGASLLAVRRGAAALAFAQLAPAEVWIGLAKAALFGATLAGVACAIGLGLRASASNIPRLASRGAVAAMLAVAALELVLVASRLS